MFIIHTVRRSPLLIAAIALGCLGTSEAMSDEKSPNAIDETPEIPTIRISDSANDIVHEVQLVAIPADDDRGPNASATYELTGESTMRIRGRTVGTATFSFSSVAPEDARLMPYDEGHFIAISSSGAIVLIEQQPNDRSDWNSFEFTILNDESESFQVSVRDSWPMTSMTKPGVLQTVLLFSSGSADRGGPAGQECTPSYNTCFSNGKTACDPLHVQLDYSCDPETGKVHCSWTCTDGSDI